MRTPASAKDPIDMLPVLAWMADTTSKCTYFNRGWLDFTGRTLKQELGDGWTESVHPADLAHCLDTYLFHFREKTPFRMEYRLKRRDGQYRWMLEQGVPRFDELGEFQGFNGSCTDITEYKAMVSELEAVRLRVELAQEGSKDGLWDWNIATGEIYFSTRWKRMLGYREYQLNNKLEEWFSRIHHDDLPKVQEALDTHFNDRRPYTVEYRIRRKDGTYLWVQDRGQAIWDLNGKPVRMAGWHTDLTELRRKNLLISQQLTALNESNIVFFADRQGRITFANDAFCKVSGYPREELLGQDVRIVKSGRHAGDFFHELWTTISEGLIWRGQIQNRAKDGSLFWVDTVIMPFRDDSGQIDKFVAILRDITRKMYLLEELEKARAAALSASELKSQFLASMSHEIRTPMNGILGLVNLMAETRLDPDQREYVSGIKQSGELLLELINDILDLSKIESGKVRLEQTVFDVVTLAQEALSIVRPVADHKKLGLEFEVAAGTPRHCQGDASRIRQILVNLLGNGVKFTEKGRVSLRVSCAPEGVRAMKDAADLRFEVEDTGIGMSREDQERIFSEFVQANSSISRKYGGTGLGLAICRKLTQLMGGNIQVRSQPGQGSTFLLHVPVKLTSNVVTLQERQQNAPAHAATPFRKLNGRVLVAEDNTINQRVIRDMLLRHDLRIDIVANGAEAIRASQAFPYDLILMDCMMPEVDGYQATQAIRQVEADGTDHPPRTPIVAMTANAMAGDRERCLDSGMDDYLPKPIDARKLAACLEHWLSPASGPAPEKGETPLLDTAALARLEQMEKEADPGLTADLVRMFLESSGEKVQDLLAKVREGDGNGIVFSAHSLKSSCTLLGVARLAKLCAQIEELARGGLLETLPALAERIALELPSARDALRAYAESHGKKVA